MDIDIDEAYRNFSSAMDKAEPIKRSATLAGMLETIQQEVHEANVNSEIAVEGAKQILGQRNTIDQANQNPITEPEDPFAGLDDEEEGDETAESDEEVPVGDEDESPDEEERINVSPFQESVIPDAEGATEVPDDTMTEPIAGETGESQEILQNVQSAFTQFMTGIEELAGMAVRAHNMEVVGKIVTVSHAIEEFWNTTLCDVIDDLGGTVAITKKTDPATLDYSTPDGDTPKQKGRYYNQGTTKRGKKYGGTYYYGTTEAGIGDKSQEYGAKWRNSNNKALPTGTYGKVKKIGGLNEFKTRDQKMGYDQFMRERLEKENAQKAEQDRRKSRADLLANGGGGGSSKGMTYSEHKAQMDTANTATPQSAKDTGATEDKTSAPRRQLKLKNGKTKDTEATATPTETAESTDEEVITPVTETKEDDTMTEPVKESMSDDVPAGVTQTEPVVRACDEDTESFERGGKKKKEEKPAESESTPEEEPKKTKGIDDEWVNEKAKERPVKPKESEEDKEAPKSPKTLDDEWVNEKAKERPVKDKSDAPFNGQTSLDTEFKPTGKTSGDHEPYETDKRPQRRIDSGEYKSREQPPSKSDAKLATKIFEDSESMVRAVPVAEQSFKDLVTIRRGMRKGTTDFDKLVEYYDQQSKEDA